MNEERCECCDLPVSMCGKAAEKRQQAEARAEYARLLALPGTTIARHDGFCGKCGEHFDEGAPIQAVSAPGHRSPIVRSNGRWRSLVCCPP